MQIIQVAEAFSRQLARCCWDQTLDRLSLEWINISEFILFLIEGNLDVFMQAFWNKIIVLGFGFWYEKLFIKNLLAKNFSLSIVTDVATNKLKGNRQIILLICAMYDYIRKGFSFI